VSAVAINQPAPDFSLKDFSGNLYHLSSRKGEKNVVLVFNRGFM
jgi:peroxiredoxin